MTSYSPMAGLSPMALVLDFSLGPERLGVVCVCVGGG